MDGLHIWRRLIGFPLYCWVGQCLVVLLVRDRLPLLSRLGGSGQAGFILVMRLLLLEIQEAHNKCIDGQIYGYRWDQIITRFFISGILETGAIGFCVRKLHWRGWMGSHYPSSVTLYVLKCSETLLAIWHGLTWDRTWASSFLGFQLAVDFQIGLQK